MAAGGSRIARAVASLMLVAMATFLLHGATMAAHAGPAGGPCRPAVAEGHAGRVHLHGDIQAEADASVDCAHAGSLQADSADRPCCSGACSVTLAPVGAPGVSAPVRLARRLQMGREDGAGSGPGGLERPPRRAALA